MKKRPTPHVHEVIGPVKLLKERQLNVAGQPVRVSVMELEPRCPAPREQRRYHKHISVEVVSPVARFQVAFATPPDVTAKGCRLTLGSLIFEIGGDWKSMTVGGCRHSFGSTDTRISLEFTEDGRLAGLIG